MLVTMLEAANTSRWGSAGGKLLKDVREIGLRNGKMTPLDELAGNYDTIVDLVNDRANDIFIFNEAVNATPKPKPKPNKPKRVTTNSAEVDKKKDAPKTKNWLMHRQARTDSDTYQAARTALETDRRLCTVTGANKILMASVSGRKIAALQPAKNKIIPAEVRHKIDGTTVEQLNGLEYAAAMRVVDQIPQMCRQANTALLEAKANKAEVESDEEDASENDDEWDDEPEPDSHELEEEHEYDND